MLVPYFEQLDPSARPGPDQTRKLVAAHLPASLPELERGSGSQSARVLRDLRKPAGRFEDGGGECLTVLLSQTQRSSSLRAPWRMCSTLTTRPSISKRIR